MGNREIYDVNFEEMQIMNIYDTGSRIELIRSLNTEEDVSSYHNWLDTHVWFEKNGDIYKRYLQDALEEFYENTGFEIGV